MLLSRRETKKKPIPFDRLDVPQLLRDIGVRTKKVEGGWAVAWCVFHDDGKNPNMHVSLRGAGFRCFSCGAKGGAMDLVMQALGVDRDQALDYLRGERSRSITKNDVRQKLAEVQNRMSRERGHESTQLMLQQISEVLTFVYPESSRTMFQSHSIAGDMDAAMLHLPSADLYTAWDWVDHLFNELEDVSDDIGIDDVSDQIAHLLQFLKESKLLPKRVVYPPRCVATGIEIPSEVLYLPLPEWGVNIESLPFSVGVVTSEKHAKESLVRKG